MAIVLVLLACAYIAVLAFLYRNQDAMIFPGAKAHGAPPSLSGYVGQTLELESEWPGQVYKAWYFRRETSRGTILYLGGNASCMVDERDRLVWLAQNFEMSIITLDFPGYGANPGHPGQRQILDLLRRWMVHFEKELKLPSESFVYFGHSLGAGAAALLASERTPRVLILEGCFTSVVDMARRQYPLFPIRWICRHPFDVASILPSLGCPLLIAHSRDDKVVPFEQGEKLSKIVGESAHGKFIELRGAHGEAYKSAGAAYAAALLSFPTENLPK